MYCLQKIRQYLPSAVSKGEKVTGSVLSARMGSSDFDRVGINQIQVGHQVVVSSGMFNYIKTSPVAEILNRTKDSIEFRTQTSVYVLTKVTESSKE